MPEGLIRYQNWAGGPGHPVLIRPQHTGAPTTDLETWDTATIQTLRPVLVADVSMTQPLACLLSAASVHPSISTGKERDTESGNDYFDARYYSCDGPLHVARLERDKRSRFRTQNSTIRRRSICTAMWGTIRSRQLDPTGHEGCCDLLPTMDEVDAVAKPLIDSAVTGVEDAAGVTVQGALGVVGFLFTAGVGSTATASHDQLYNEEHRVNVTCQSRRLQAVEQ